jgi:hypothetical protein
MQVLKQSTSAIELVGPVLDASGVAVTSAAIADFQLTKNGATAAMSGNTISHSHNGHYLITLTTTNTDTLGRLTVSVNNAAMAMSVFRWNVLTANAFDALVTNGNIAKTGDAMALSPNQDVRNVTGTVTDSSGVTALLSRLSPTRAGNLDNLDVAISVIQSQITSLNNLSAKANWFGSLLLEVPDSGTRAYAYELVVKDDEDKLVNLDANPTIALTNAAGTDRSTLITTTIANPSTGRYTLTITVGTSTANESLKLTASGTVSGEARYAVIAPQVVDYDNATQVALLLTRIGTPNVSIAADIATRASQTSVDTIDDLLDTEMPALTAAVAAEAVKTAAIKAKADQLTFTTANKVDAAAVLDPASLRSALGMSAADLDSQLDAILAAASAGAGTGARTVTITVNDGTNALQNAIVRFTEGANTFRALTNASGVAVFNLDDATYTVAVTKSGYTYAGTTMVVNGTETATYSMTAVSVTPPTNPDLSAVVVLCLGTDFEAESGVTIDLRIVTFPSGSTNTAYPGLKQTATSNGSGIATLEAPKGSVCEWKRGKEDSWTEITIGSGDQTNVTSIIGSRY